jgi:hypothetical protein
MISLWSRRIRAHRPRSHRRAWVAAGLLAIVACGDPVGPLPREGAPERLSFTIGAFAAGSTNVDLRGDAVVTVRLPFDPRTPADTVRVVPTAQAWRDFWTAAEEVGVRRWRQEYRAEGVVDGSGWVLRIENKGTVVYTYGSNAYPDRQGREHEMEMTDDFRAFLDALGTLAGYDF